MNEYFAKIIKAHIKHDIEVSPETYGDWTRFLKSFKVESFEIVAIKEYSLHNRSGKFVKYRVTTSHKAPKWENDRVIWEVNLYDDDSHGVYFDGTYAA